MSGGAFVVRFYRVRLRDTGDEPDVVHDVEAAVNQPADVDENTGPSCTRTTERYDRGMSEQPSLGDIMADALIGVPTRLWEMLQANPVGWLFVAGAVVLLLGVRALSARAARRRRPPS